MREDHARWLLDEAVARTLRERTAWVRQFVRAGRDAPCAADLRVEGAVDPGRRVGVVVEAHRQRRTSEEVGLLWATTEFLEYRVPVVIPDLTAGVPAAVQRGAGAPRPLPAEAAGDRA